MSVYIYATEIKYDIDTFSKKPQNYIHLKKNKQNRVVLSTGSQTLLEKILCDVVYNIMENTQI